MANALFLHPYHSDLVTVSASSYVADLPPANVQTSDLSAKWRSLAGSGTSLDFDFGIAMAILTAHSAGSGIGTEFHLSTFRTGHRSPMKAFLKRLQAVLDEHG